MPCEMICYADGRCETSSLPTRTEPANRNSSLTRRSVVGGTGGALAAAGLPLLSACARLDKARLKHAANVLNRGNCSDISSLDPHFITGNWEAYVVGDCLLGLTTEGDDGNA